MSGNRKTGRGSRRAYMLPHRVRWGDQVSEKKIAEHGYEAGLDNKPVFCNPTKGDVARLTWLEGFRRGLSERRSLQRKRA